MLIQERTNIHADDEEALRLAVHYSHIETIKFLVAKNANVHANNDEALKLSASNEHDNVWQLLSSFIQEKNY